METIKTPAKGIAKDKAGKAAPKAKTSKGLEGKKAVEASGAQESGFKKKRLVAVPSIKMQ